jgi:hypothetical protein
VHEECFHNSIYDLFTYSNSFKTRPDWLIWDSIGAGLESDQVEEKIKEEKTRYNPATRLKIWLQSIDFYFYFFIKTTSF